MWLVGSRFYEGVPDVHGSEIDLILATWHLTWEHTTSVVENVCFFFFILVVDVVCSVCGLEQ